MATTLEVLQKDVSDLKDKRDTVKIELDKLNSDPTYLNILRIYTDPKVKARADAWIDSAGVFWTGADALHQHEAARLDLIAHDTKESKLQSDYKEYDRLYNEALTRLSKYEQSSPTIKAQVEASNAAAQIGLNTSSVRTVLVVVGTFLVAVFIVVLTKKFLFTKTNQ